MAIDFSFIRQLEGFETEGYIPQNEEGILGESGVTVGSGIDLGQWTRKQLESAGVDKAILDKIEPYLGKKKQKALDLLNQQPLQLGKEEAEALTTAVKKNYADRVKKWYNKNNQTDNDWSDLTDRQQTSITSVAFQYGVGSPKTPSFNKQVLNNDWKGLTEELRNFGDKYTSRRHKELQYLVGTTPDGALGPQTEQAIDRFVTTQEVMTPDVPQPQAPQLDPMGFLDNLTAILKERLKGEQSAPESISEGVTESEQDRSSSIVRQLADQIKEKRKRGEAKLERTANEAKLEAEAEQAVRSSPDRKLVERLSKSEVIKSKVYDRSNLNKPTDEPTEGLAGGRDDSKDPIFGIF